MSGSARLQCVKDRLGKALLEQSRAVTTPDKSPEERLEPLRRFGVEFAAVGVGVGDVVVGRSQNLQ